MDNRIRFGYITERQISALLFKTIPGYYTHVVESYMLYLGEGSVSEAVWCIISCVYDNIEPYDKEPIEFGKLVDSLLNSESVQASSVVLKKTSNIVGFKSNEFILAGFPLMQYIDVNTYDDFMYELKTFLYVLYDFVGLHNLVPEQDLFCFSSFVKGFSLTRYNSKCVFDV